MKNRCSVVRTKRVVFSIIFFPIYTERNKTIVRYYFTYVERDQNEKIVSNWIKSKPKMRGLLEIGYVELISIIIPVVRFACVVLRFLTFT